MSLDALFCEGFWGYDEMLSNYRFGQIRAEPCKLLLPVGSKIGSKMERVTTKFFYLSHSMPSGYSEHLFIISPTE